MSRTVTLKNRRKIENKKTSDINANTDLSFQGSCVARGANHSKTRVLGLFGVVESINLSLALNNFMIEDNELRIRNE